MKCWFDVDKEGLKKLQEGKPKHYIVRELIQNAWDEDISLCEVFIHLDEEGRCIVSVLDDAPDGFKDITDAFTLFKHTTKRHNPNQRGRFNLGEKQAFARCDYCSVETTKGTVQFSKKGREQKNNTLEKGSKITVIFKATQDELEDIHFWISQYLPPKNIEYRINHRKIPYKMPWKIISERLRTELAGQDGVLRKTTRKTKIDIYKPFTETQPVFLYEMGIPICKIDCDYGINVQQKIPLSVDRETVPESYLQDLYTILLNNVHEELTEDNCSQSWVRIGSSDESVSSEAINSVVNKRYGDKVVVANPFDKRSIDEALSNGYRVIHGSELSKEEWNNIKRDGAIKSSSEIFGKGSVGATYIEPTRQMSEVAMLAKKIANLCLGVKITVLFYKSDATCLAEYGNRTLSFNVKRLGQKFFNTPLNTLSLILHELGHEKGHHTEASYHRAITDMGERLVIEALENPKFFKGNK